MKPIISATDGTEGAERAVAAAADLVKSINGKLFLVNVSEDDLSSELRLLDQLPVSEGDALEEISQRILTKAEVIVRDHGAANIGTISGAGDPAEAIMEIANLKHADAIHPAAKHIVLALEVP